MSETTRIYDKKILGYMIVHYGSYLKEAIQSLAPWVEKIMIFYVANPSFGHTTTHTCPDSGEDLKKIAEAASDKVQWWPVTSGNEGHHRSLVFEFAQGYDGVMTVDSDEVLEQADLAHAIKLCWETDKRNIGFGGYINFWKSFNYACYDGFTPIRFINLHNGGGQGVVPVRVYHFGYAQSSAIVDYKMLIHGHKDEIRPGWYEDIYKKWTPDNCVFEGGLHPTANNLWIATPFNIETLPWELKQHPNFSKGEIE